MFSCRTRLWLAVWLGLLMTDTSLGQSPAASGESRGTRGHLVIIGGGMRPDNAPLFQTLIGFAGGPDKARFVILPTASISPKDSHLFAEELKLYGVAADRVDVLDVTEHNAATSTSDQKILEKVRAATGLFLSGGDQRRLVRALTRKTAVTHRCCKSFANCMNAAESLVVPARGHRLRVNACWQSQDCPIA